VIRQQSGCDQQRLNPETTSSRFHFQGGRDFSFFNISETSPAQRGTPSPPRLKGPGWPGAGGGKLAWRRM